MQELNNPWPEKEEIKKAIDIVQSKKSFSYFVKEAWHVIEPSTNLKWGWAMDAICEHLQAVTNEEIFRLLMNVPPGTSKSTLTSVMWPAWEWAIGLTSKRYLSTAHKQDLATRDNLKCRRLIQSEWYQARFPHVELVLDQNAKTKFENTKTGFREAMAFKSMTGSRGDRVILDDPLSVDDANSDAELLAAELAFTETLPTRVNNEKSAIVVIMQRISEKDTSGIILDRNLDFTHLCLPMEYEADKKCKTIIGFSDPREEEGELLFPERFGKEQVDQLKLTMGSFAVAGQFQQRPVPRGGGLFNREWFQYVDSAPLDTKWVRGWDLAASANKGAAFTAGVKVGKAKDGRIFIADCRRGQLTAHGVRELLVKTAAQDGNKTRISIPQDPGQAGKAQVQGFAQDLAGYDVRFSPESGDKETRAMPISAQAEAGNVYIVRGAWNQTFIDEISSFPNGKFKDQVDALSRGYHELLKITKNKSVGVSAQGPIIIE
jgi:predicted phage terminase large subunit-like protein